MTERLHAPFKFAPEAYKAIMAIETAVKASGLELSLIELVKMRASQINHCAFCIHMHSTDARKEGESEMRLYMLDAWRESTLYTPRERAALAWTESLTLVSKTEAPDADYDLAAKEFNDTELVHLSFLIGTINMWNRLAIGFRLPHPK